jgi:hypothetical protein
VRLFSLAATYGVTDRLDMGMLIPLVQVDMKLKSSARIITSPENSIPGVHTFAGAVDNVIEQTSDEGGGGGGVHPGAPFDPLLVGLLGCMLAYRGWQWRRRP